MPILAKKDNPPSRFPDIPILETTNDWFIAKVRARQEKALAFDMMAHGMGYYLPVITKSIKRPDTGKKRTSILPLFPSYLPFECESAPTWLVRSERVIAIIRIKAKNRFRQQLHAIYQARDCDLVIASHTESEYTLGRQVRLLEGPCTGLVGTVVKHISECILVMQVEGLGCAGIRVNAEDLELVGEKERNL
jgi:hypothetical protein